VLSTAISPDGKYLASGGLNSTARVWEIATGKEISHITHDGFLSSVAFSPDGNYVVSGGGNTVRVRETTTGREISLMTHDGAVESVAFSPDGKYVVSGSFDNTLRIWEALTGKEVSRITQDGYVYSVAFSPDGKYVVSGSKDGTARVWDVATDKEIARMTHDYEVESVAFSPDGKYVVSGSKDGTARVWEASTGKELARKVFDGAVYSVAFSPMDGGKYVVSGNEDKTVRIWIWQTADLTSNACARLSRNLTYAEWNQYIGEALPYQVICPEIPLDLEYVKTIAQNTLSDSNDPNRVKTALDKVKTELIKVIGIKDPDAETFSIVSAAIVEQISKEATFENIKKALDLTEQAKQMQVQISIDDANILNSLCWFGSLQGYTKQVLQHCESAVKLAPDIGWIRDARGLARALMGDFEGAILDFRYFVDNPGNYDGSEVIVQRKQWIEQLKKGINPFTPEVLKSIKDQ
jgi:WD40 repeat protein